MHFHLFVHAVMRPAAAVLATAATLGVLLLLPAGPAQGQVVTQPFTFNLVTHDLPHVRHGDAAWGDMDGDGDLDVFLSGIATEGGVSGLFLNDGADENGVTFTASGQSFPALHFSTASWADIDADGDLDLALFGSRTGERPYDAASHLFINNDGTFTAATGHGIPAAYSASVDWGDINNDGHLDAILIGFESGNTPHTSVLLGDGNGAFTEEPTTLPHLTLGSARLGDMNGNGRLDVVLSGVAGQSGFVSDVFLATDDGDFAAQSAALPQLGFSSLELGDVDNDGDLDVFVSGAELSRDLLTGRTQLFINSGGSLGLAGDLFTGSLAGAATLGDYDGDGDLDVLLLGAETALGRRSATVYSNTEDGYTATVRLHGSLFSSAEWGDIDGDGDLDLVTTGLTTTGIAATSLYLNQQQVVPELPGAPAARAAEVSGSQVALSWARAAQEVTYNLRVGTAPGQDDVMAAESDAVSGRRLVPRPGNVRSQSEWIFQNLHQGTYYWSVQAVSHAFRASGFSEEGTFTVNTALSTDTDVDAALPTEFAVQSLYPNPLSGSGRLVIDLPAPDRLRITLYNALGARIARMDLGALGAGTQHIAFDPATISGQALSPGLYFFDIEGLKERQTGSFTYLPTR